MRPTRETMRSNEYAYFVSTQTTDRKPFFRHERWAQLMIGILKHYGETEYVLHAYVIMPDHLHLLLTPFESVEKSVQLIKGGFSFRAKRELEWPGGIWQTGFTDHRIRDEEDWQHHLEYIRQNPVQARLVEDSVLYPYMNFPNKDFPRGLKPLASGGPDVRAKARTLHSEDFPQGLKPLASGGPDVRAKARTLHSSADGDFPQGLKPVGSCVADVRAEARTLHSSADGDFPQGLKPLASGGPDVRAKARTLQSQASTLQAQASTVHSSAGGVFPRGLKPLASGGPDVRAKARTLRNFEPSAFVQSAVKGTGFSPSDMPALKTRASAHEDAKR